MNCPVWSWWFLCHTLPFALMSHLRLSLFENTINLFWFLLADCSNTKFNWIAVCSVMELILKVQHILTTDHYQRPVSTKATPAHSIIQIRKQFQQCTVHDIPASLSKTMNKSTHNQTLLTCPGASVPTAGLTCRGMPSGRTTWNLRLPRAGATPARATALLGLMTGLETVTRAMPLLPMTTGGMRIWSLDTSSGGRMASPWHSRAKTLSRAPPQRKERAQQVLGHQQSVCKHKRSQAKKIAHKAAQILTLIFSTEKKNQQKTCRWKKEMFSTPLFKQLWTEFLPAQCKESVKLSCKRQNFSKRDMRKLSQARLHKNLSKLIENFL